MFSRVDPLIVSERSLADRAGPLRAVVCMVYSDQERAGHGVWVPGVVGTGDGAIPGGAPWYGSGYLPNGS